MKTPVQLILIGGFIFAGAAVVSLVSYTSRPPVPDARLKAVKLGMASQSVHELLGPPTNIQSYSNDAALGVTGANWASDWIYERRLPWSTAWVYVCFTNGWVSRISQDSFP